MIYLLELMGVIVKASQPSEIDITNRYTRMVHAALLGKEQVGILLDRINRFSARIPELIDYTEEHLQTIYQARNTVQHISIYGSYLYNEKDPDDIDLLVVVDSSVML